MIFLHRVNMSNRYVLFFIILILLTSNVFNCQETESNFINTNLGGVLDVLDSISFSNIEEYILEQVIDNRVLMLGDGDHTKICFKKQLLAFLDYWINSIVDKNVDAPSSLVLFVEQVHDSSFVSALQLYFKSNDVSYILNNTDALHSFYLNDIEFYYELKCLYNKINKLNEKGYNINLDIQFPEKILDFKNWSKDGTDHFFLKERDEYASEYIINYLDRHLDYKAIVFYGMLHFIKEEAIKLKKPTPQTGYYLAHYLNDYFGDDFYRIGQWLARDINIVNPIIFKISDLVYTGNSDIYNKYYYVSTYYSDSVILLNDSTSRRFRICDVPSQYTYEALIRAYTKYYDVDNEFIMILKKYVLDRLHLFNSLPYSLKFDEYKNIALLDQDFKDIVDKYSCINVSNVDSIVAFTYIEKYLDIIESSQSFKTNSEKWNYLYNESILMDYLKPFLKLSNFDYKTWSDAIQLEKDELIVSQLICLLWIGNEDEKIKASQYLEKLTNKSFVNKMDWSQWLRQNYCN